ncbi:kinase-like protein [Schizopora paradoxa]|uniref:Kinase-like protein n=1 Tax=Schizopora paradoxa TaxID=27342 RepID=A0A0H2S1Z8_9AGAM|nr:kinase-like protein [Schizopora paradoxa]
MKNPQNGPPLRIYLIKLKPRKPDLMPLMVFANLQIWTERRTGRSEVAVSYSTIIHSHSAMTCIFVSATSNDTAILEFPLNPRRHGVLRETGLHTLRDRRKSASLVTLRSSSPSSSELTLNNTFNALHIAADLGGVPGLFKAVTLVESITELCKNVRRNRNEARQLCDECKDLCETIEEARKGGRKPAFIQKMVDEFISLLREIQAEMKQWSSLSYWKSFIYRVAVAESIAAYGKRLDRMTKKFQIDALTHISIEPSRYEESRRKDRAEAIQEFARPDFASQFMQLASDAKGKGEEEDIRQTMGQVIQDLGDDDTLNSADREQLRENLFIISDAIGKLPTSLRIPPELLVFDTSQAVAGSTIYDICKGTYLTLTVAVKKARAFACVEGSVQHIIKEAKNWRSACEVDPKEEFILQLIGVSFPDESFVIISRWMEERDLLTYIKKFGESVNRRHMVKRIAKGLRILHEHLPPITHGHLKASNIMINANGDPLLADLKLLEFKEYYYSGPTEYDHIHSSVRWFAPEMPDGDSTHSDIYSLAMTVLELMTGQVPFNQTRRTTSVLIAATDGLRPERPTDPAVEARGLDDRLWDLMNRCWAQEPEDRPSIKEVNDELEAMWASS